MKVVTLKDVPNVPVEGADRIEGWTGPVSRSRQTIIEPGDSPNYNCSVVNFSQGCTTGWHTHDCDQVLVVTAGSGMVATEREQREINVGDVVHIRPVNAIGMAPRPIRLWGISRSQPSAVRPAGDSPLCRGSSGYRAVCAFPAISARCIRVLGTASFRGEFSN
jgi:quercetin dioxygenase-like cupin family protein